MKHLYRCRHDRRIAGVASGVAEYFDLDPTLVRIVWFVSMFFGLVTLVLYIGMAIIVPLEPESAVTPAVSTDPGHRHASNGTGRLTTFIGIALVLFGTLALLDVAIPAISWRFLWPLFVLGIGAVLIAGSLRQPARTFAPSGPTPTTPGSTVSAAPAPVMAAPAVTPAAAPVPAAPDAAEPPAADPDPLTDTTAG